MDIKQQPALSFGGVDIINVEFRSSKPFSSEEEINIGIDARLISKEGSDTFKILMIVSLICDNHFEFRVDALGNFKLNNVSDDRTKEQLINVNAPPIMFPYVRAFITTFTSNCGNALSSIVLPPHSFGERKLKLLDNEGE